MTPGRIARVLQIHTRYRQAGGEDGVVDAERTLLSENGIQVDQLLFDNADLQESKGIASDLRLGLRSVWSREAAARVADVVRAIRPDVVHVHNTFAAASPSVLRAARSEGTPVVHTLHNYRLICPAATAFRDGAPCTDCVGRFIPWTGVLHACVRGSRAQSAVAATTLTVHRASGTFHRQVDGYLALTEVQRDLMIRGGLPGRRIHVVPNFLEPDPGSGAKVRTGLVFVGRLSQEKGVSTLLAAAQRDPGLIRIVGDGPMRAEVERMAESGAVAYFGPAGREEVLDALRNAVGLVMPSIWFEGFPLVVLEAFASGTPLVASRIGSLAEIVEDGVTGLLVEPGDPTTLAERMRWALDHPDEMRAMGARAREQYERRYRGPTHLAMLLDVYRAAVERRSAHA
jgi:glycosyltransferase involved in cell wall biosynthesis